MNTEQYLLIKLSEELAEVQKEISKALIFGLKDVNPTTDKTNKYAMEQEMTDVFGVLGMLSDRGIISGLGILAREDKIKSKKEKVLLWMQYSEDKGILNDEK